MNKEQAQGKIQQFSGKLKETWARLTDDDIALFDSQREQFFGRLKEKYGLAKEDAEKRIAELERADKAA